MSKLTRTARLQQALGIAVMLAIWLTIASKGFDDLSMLAETQPHDIWRALARYFLDNMAAGAGEQGMCYGPGSCPQP
ncbi:MAG: hypothetical protein GTO67_00640 [Gammaproteobacteria bacterium]|nr:hypothetical protein [Gammaproteobacteria bacterium]NIM72404.1 hypothetical protein [Gammaproteobacteria bacterium]NIN37271.1 hypothetical protein [Gammaproteobacteria bacterium]NIO24161.1 hypothetical protein [Gammaproteobacteria bacterium]NIO64768.1 hypothetical protein [Gammaproteobacteria bacterium]